MRRATALGIRVLVLLSAGRAIASDSIYVWIFNSSSGPPANVSLAGTANTCVCPNPPVSSSDCVGDTSGNPASVAPGDEVYWVTMEPDPSAQCIVVNVTAPCTANGSSDCSFTVVNQIVGPIFDYSCSAGPAFACTATAKQGAKSNEYSLWLQLGPPVPTPVVQ